MTDIYAASVDREGLLSCLSGSAPPNVRQLADFASDRDSTSRSQKIELLWRGSPKNKDLPNLIVIDNADIKEFVAFTTTYVASYSPFSAFFRVIARQDLRAIEQRMFSPKLKLQIPAELVGVIIAEAFMQLGGQAKSVEDISVQACFATLSATIYRSVISGFENDSIPEVARNWGSGRSLLVEDTLRLGIPFIGEFWKIVSEALNPKSLGPLGDESFQLIEFVSSFLRQRQVDAVGWRRLTSDTPDIRNIPDQMGGTREDRIRMLEKSLGLLRASSRLRRQTRELMFGYLVSLLAEGSLAYLDLSARMAPDLPTSTLWYALFCSLSKNADVLSIGGSLGRRLARDLVGVVDVMAAPSADISLAELTVLASDHPRKLLFRTNFASSLDVEIFPAINARYRTKRQIAESMSPSLSKTRLDELRALTLRLQNAVIELDRESDAGRFPEHMAVDAPSNYRLLKKRPKK